METQTLDSSANATFTAAKTLAGLIGMKLVPKDFKCDNCTELGRDKGDLEKQVEILKTQHKDNFLKIIKSLNMSPTPPSDEIQDNLHHDDHRLLSVEFQHRVVAQVEQSMIELRLFKAKWSFEDLLNGKVPQLTMTMVTPESSTTTSGNNSGASPSPSALTSTSSLTTSINPGPNESGGILRTEGSSSTLSSTSANSTKIPASVHPLYRKWLARECIIQGTEAAANSLLHGADNVLRDPDHKSSPESSARPAKVTIKRKSSSDMQTPVIMEVRGSDGIAISMDQCPSISSVVLEDLPKPPPVFPVTPLPSPVDPLDTDVNVDTVTTLPSTAGNLGQGQGRPPTTPPPRTNPSKNDNMTITMAGSSGTCNSTSKNSFPSKPIKSTLKKRGMSALNPRKSARMVKIPVRYGEDLSDLESTCNSSNSGGSLASSPKRKRKTTDDKISQDSSSEEDEDSDKQEEAIKDNVYVPRAAPAAPNGQGGGGNDDGGSKMFLKLAKCEFCDFKPETMEELKHHMSIHHVIRHMLTSLKVVCRRCQFTFDAESFLNHPCRNTTK